MFQIAASERENAIEDIRWTSWELVLAFLVALFFGLFSRHQDLYSLFSTFVADDSLYYLKTAQNFVLGRGSTFDGVNPTNGYQPLWFLVVALWFWLENLFGLGGDAVASFYRLLYLQIFIYAAIVAIIGTQFMRLSQNRILTWAFVLTLTTFGSRLFTNLLETPLQLLLVLIVFTMAWRIFATKGQPSLARVAFLGFLSVLAFLARTDAVFLVFGMNLALLLRYGWNLRLLAAFNLPCALIASAYFLVNWNFFGTLMPISGRIKMDATRNLLEAEGFFGFLVAKLAMVLGPYGLFTVPAKLALQFLAFVPFGVFAYRHLLRKAEPAETALFALATYLLGKYLFYTIVYHSYRAEAYWYWCIDGVTAMLLAAWIARYFLKWASSPLVIPSLLLLVTIVGMGYVTQRRLGRMNTNVKPEVSTSYLLDLAEVMKDDFFEDKRIGSFHTGILGYFSGRQVTNLDGLINSTAFYQLITSGGRDAFIGTLDVVVEYSRNFGKIAERQGLVHIDVSHLVETPLPTTTQGMNLYLKPELVDVWLERTQADAFH